MSMRRVDAFIRTIAVMSPPWRTALGLIGSPSSADLQDALDALERLCVRIHDAQKEALLHDELMKIVEVEEGVPHE